MDPVIVRVNAVLIEDDRILQVEQDVSESRHWAHPGGRLDPGETLEQCCVREVKEETGLDVSPVGLLYVADRIVGDSHVVVVSFQVKKEGGKLGTGSGPEFASGKIKSVKMIPLDELRECGYSAEYCRLVKLRFPDRGTYIGNVLD